MRNAWKTIKAVLKIPYSIIVCLFVLHCIVIDENAAIADPEFSMKWFMQTNIIHLQHTLLKTPALLLIHAINQLPNHVAAKQCINHVYIYNA